jgi:hypothetical protein
MDSKMKIISEAFKKATRKSFAFYTPEDSADQILQYWLKKNDLRLEGNDIIRNDTNIRIAILGKYSHDGLDFNMEVKLEKSINYISIKIDVGV